MIFIYKPWAKTIRTNKTVTQRNDQKCFLAIVFKFQMLKKILSE